MNGPSVISKNYLATVGLDWKIAGIGDFNGDGKQNILWQNSSDGTVVAWLMNGLPESGVWITQTPLSRDWQIVGTPDVFGNKGNNILWSDSTTGEQVLWQINQG